MFSAYDTLHQGFWPFPKLLRYHFNGCEELANTQSQMRLAFSCPLTRTAKTLQAVFSDTQVLH